MKPSSPALAALLFAAVPFVAVPSAAASRPAAAQSVKQGSVRALQVAWQTKWKAASPLDIAVGEEPQRAVLQLPPLAAAAGQTLGVRFRARLYTAQPGGWNHFLKLEVNGKDVGPTTKKRQLRLLNRAQSFGSSYSTEAPQVPYFDNKVGQLALATFFSPDGKALSPEVLTGREEADWYLLDIGDLLHAKGSNTLSITNLAIKRYWDGKPPADLRLIVEDLEVGAIPLAEITRLRQANFVRRRLLNGISIGDADTGVTATPGGGLQVRQKGEAYFVESLFSYPGATGIGYNAWRCLPATSGENGWKAGARRLSANSLSLSGEGRFFRVVRKVTLRGPRVEIVDTLQNKTAEPIGILLRHEIVTPELAQAQRLSGQESVFRPEYSEPENPTAFIAQAKSALGVVCEDTISRLQLGMAWQDNVTRLSFNHIGLAGGATRQLKWALYPSSRAAKSTTTESYFNFINQVRRDWKVNFTVQGPFDFYDPKYALPGMDEEAYIRDLVERKGVKIFALNPWFEYYSNADQTRAEYKALIQERMRKIKRVRPDAICIACIETNLTRIPLSFFGDTLPADLPYGRPGQTYPFGKSPGSYTLPVTPAMQAKIEASPWRDSVFYNRDGKIVVDTWYAQNYEGKALNFRVYPTLTNHWHQEMLDKIRFLLDDVGCDGVYIDQFSLAFGQADHFSFNRWDNTTVDIDAKSGKITRRYTDIARLSAPARKQWVEEVLKRGKLVVANTNPATAEQQTLPISRFMETSEYDVFSTKVPDRYMLAKGQLGSPVGLGYALSAEARAKGAPLYNRSVIAHLHYGMLYYYYLSMAPPTGENGGEFGPVKHMFPLTPIALGEGYVIGKERIVTCISRTFERSGKTRPVVHFFDERGRERRPAAGELKIEGGTGGKGWRIAIKLRDWWQIAVIE